MVKVGVTRLKESQKVCNYCGGKLRSLAREERNQIRLRYDCPLGVYICEDCEELATIIYTVMDTEMQEWTEAVEHISEADILTEKEAITKAIESIAIMPEGQTIVISIGRMFRCEGNGMDCKLYRLASCGLGDERFCPNKWCNYDPYPEEYKKRFWYKTKSTWPEDNLGVIDYWTDIITDSDNVQERINAIKRIGTVLVPEVSETLLPIIFFEKDIEARKAALSALAKHKLTEQIQHAFYHCLRWDSEKDLQLLALKLLRDMRWADAELSEKVAYLTAKDELKKNAAITLRILQKKANTEKSTERIKKIK